MKQDFIYLIENTFAEKIFTDEDLKIVFSNKSLTQIHNSLTYHLKQSHIKRFKRGMYSLTTKKKNSISKFSIANALYGPSYVSFESALSHHGLIPEAVYETTSACFQDKKKSFKTDDGIFSYFQIPLQPFFLEVSKNEIEGFLIANPMRALFDLVYSQRKQYEKFNDLEEDLRIDLDELRIIMKNYDASEIYQLGELYKKKTTKTLSDILVRGLK